ncbi:MULTISPECIES: anti-sigma factor domain-containing protein [unclassified Bradyrhizobium]|uniref:anti-sigma factor n=1 Tax=unclassified Bradyrhizobium TaxID=2631580 RepID=UPI0028E63D27|nr:MULTISPECIES: anti-sigma factor [unclassified Bradyrhizobium]
MAYSEDHIALAAEYALGTLDAAERAQVETMMAVDKDFVALVQAWEFRLGPLNQMVGLVEPRPELWERIKAEIARLRATAESAPAGQVTIVEAPVVAAQPEPAPPEVPPVEAEAAPIHASPVSEPEPEVAAPVITPTRSTFAAGEIANDDTNVVQLSSKVRQLRAVANIMTALAAVLLALVGVQVYRPDLLPRPLQPKPRIQTVEVKVPVAQPSAQFVALLQKDAASPAFILTVDAASKSYTVRRVGAAPEPGKSFELWLVSDKLQKPRSLGVIGGSDFTSRPVLSSYDADTVNRATYAVTVEPEGGSPTGQATGPIVFTGKLIETVPSAR